MARPGENFGSIKILSNLCTERKWILAKHKPRAGVSKKRASFAAVGFGHPAGPLGAQPPAKGKIIQRVLRNGGATATAAPEEQRCKTEDLAKRESGDDPEPHHAARILEVARGLGRGGGDVSAIGARAAEVSQPARSVRSAVRGDRRRRHHGEAGGGETRGQARATVRGRKHAEPRWHRRGARRAVAASGRLYDRPSDQRHRDQRRDLQLASVRSGQGFRADLADRQLRSR